jgi:hypothetical protein
MRIKFTINVRKYFLTVTIIFLQINIYSQESKYNFPDYPVKNNITNLDTSTINYLSKIKLMSGDSPLQYVKYEPNFAAYFEIIEWSCGTACRQAVIIDYRNGKILDSIDYCYDLEYRINSLLIIADNNDDEICSVKYYKIENGKILELN